MGYAEQLVKHGAIVGALQPQTTDPLMPIVGGAVTLKWNDHATVIISAGTIAAMGSAFVMLEQDVSVIPTVVLKQLVFDRYWTNAADTTSSIMLEYDCPMAGVFVVDTANATYAIEVDGDWLDATNDYDCIRVVIGPSGKVPCYVSAAYVLTKSRYAGAVMGDVRTD